MNFSESINNVSKAFVEAKKELKNTYNSGENPFLHSSYTPLDKVLESVNPILSKHGLAILQNPHSIIDGDKIRVKITSVLLHESGEYIEFNEGLLLPLVKNTPQDVGSCITYFRRYTVMAILGISGSDDDDGNSSSGVNKNQQYPVQKQNNHQPQKQQPANQAPQQNGNNEKMATNEDIQKFFNKIEKFDYKDTRSVMDYIQIIKGFINKNQPFPVQYLSDAYNMANKICKQIKN